MALSILTGIAVPSPGEQIRIEPVEQMPNQPSPYLLRDWKQVARDFDALAFDENAEGEYLPLIWLDTSDTNYPFPGFGLYSAVGHFSQGSGVAREGITCIPAVVGASLAGIDKSDQNGRNWVILCQKFFNKDNGENVVLDSANARSANVFTYTLAPNHYFCQLVWLYPDEGNPSGELESIFRTIANRWYDAELVMGGGRPTFPDFNHLSFDFRTMQPVDSDTEPDRPDTAGGVAWLEYMAYKHFGDLKYLDGADWGMQFLEQCSVNPLAYHFLAYGAYTAARMNGELGRRYDVEKLVNWVFGPSDGDSRPGWGIVRRANWGGRDCDGLVGATQTPYVFAYDTYETVSQLVPLVRYDDRFARAIGKWTLNVANSSRYFYPDALPAENQDNLDWAQAMNPTYCIGYEGLKRDKLISLEGTIEQYAHLRTEFYDISTSAKTLQIRLISGGSQGENTGTLSMDNIVVMVQVPGEINPVSIWPNSGLEFGSGNLPDSWNRVGPDSLLVWDTAEPASGNRALKIADDDTSEAVQWASEMIPLPESYDGGTVIVEWDWKYDITSNNPDNRWRISLVFRDEKEQIVSGPRVYPGEQTLSPYATGAFIKTLQSASTNLGVYGSSHVGLLGAIIEPTNVEMILQLDLLATDFFQDISYPTFLYYNPYEESKTIEIDVGDDPTDLYDAVSNGFIRRSVIGLTTFNVEADSAIVLVLAPAGGALTVGDKYTDKKVFIDGVAVDFNGNSGPSSVPNWISH